MTSRSAIRHQLSKLLEQSDLSFSDFVEIALYHPQFGYYSRAENPVGKGADYVTSPHLSPVFGFALGRLINEFVSRSGDEVSTIVDVGCGDGQLLHSLWSETSEKARERARFFGVDRSLSRVPESARQNPALAFVRTIEELPRDGIHLLLSNELFDAFPFARLVQRDEHLHELWVTERDGELDWTEHEAAAPWEDYFVARGIDLEDGQFADVSQEWEAYYADLCAFPARGLLVTLDYGYPEEQLFHGRVRRFGTAASYSRQRVTRDLLSDPGERDLTAHINFSDLIRAGEKAGLKTLFFERQARFLLALGASEHELFTPVTDLEVSSLASGVDLLQQRDEARRLILPDGIGEEVRVLVQSKNLDAAEWSFQRKLFEPRTED